MKVLNLAMLALAVLVIGTHAATPEERNLRGAVEMYHSGAHRASYARHSAMEARGSFQEYTKQLKQRAKEVKMPKHNMEAQAGAVASGHKAQHHAVIESRVKPKQKEVHHKAGKKKPSMEELPTPSEDEVPIAEATTSVSDGVEGGPEGPPGNSQQSDSVPQAIGGERGATMDASDSLQDYFEQLDHANEIDPPQYNKEAQAEAAIADASNPQHATSTESNNNFANKGTAFETQLHNQKPGKGKKDKKGL